MRQHLANVILASTTLSGCSLIYDTNELPKIDAPPDQAIDAPDAYIAPDSNPALLMLTAVKPAVLVEGQGADGSRPAVLVIEGVNIVKANTSVAITAASGAPMITVDNDKLEVSLDGKLLAVPVTLPVDEAASDTIALDITVTQDSPSGPVTQPLNGMVMLQRLPELKNGDALLTNGFPGSPRVFSRIDITAGTIKGVTPPPTEPVRIRATSSVTIANAATIAVAASAMTPGPAGGTGGRGGAVLGGNGEAGTGPAGGPEGVDGGFNGDTPLKTLAVPNRSSGGGGGSGALGGGNGGGGGGSIEIIADGNLAIPGVNARGAAGGSGGGSGSGGIVLLRAGGTLTVTGMVDVRGGDTDGNVLGRARYDAGGTVSFSAGSAYRGPAIVTSPLISKVARPMLQAIGTDVSTVGYFIVGGGMSTGILTTDLGIGATNFTPAVDLYPGLNQLCLLVAGADKTSDTRSCIDIAYVPGA